MRWIFPGFFLIIVHLILMILSKQFVYGASILEKPILLQTSLQITAGILYLLAAQNVVITNFSRQKSQHRGIVKSIFYSKIRLWEVGEEKSYLLIWIITAGMVMRILMFFSTPMLEDDYYRYLWDGAVVGNGINPYTHSPKEILFDSPTVPPELKKLSVESREVVQRINHPRLRTIYPPIAQLTFALAYWIKPWSIFALRAVLLFFDLTAIGLLMIIIRKLNLSPLLLSIYWWNPILIKESFNSCHMDVVLLPFLAGIVLCIIYRKSLWAVVITSLGLGVKLWPIVILPSVLRTVQVNLKELVPALLLFVGLFLVLAIPVYTTGLGNTSGFTAYGRYWEMNDALFMLILWAVEFLLKLFKSDSINSQVLTRIFVVLLLIAIIVRVNWKKPVSPGEFIQRCLVITTALFLLSPVQFPWYYLWILPFLTIEPRNSLLLLTALLPIYYLRFYFRVYYQAELFDNYIVWLEYIPVWSLLFWQWYRSKPKPMAERGI